MKVSVIIPTKDRIEDVVECIHSIRKQSILPYEIIVVDASSTDLLEEVIKILVTNSEISYIYLKQREKGLTKARNIGIEHAIGDVILFLDDDVILDTKYIQNILQIYEDDDMMEIGGVCGVFKKKEYKSWISFTKKAFAHFFLIDSPADGKVLSSSFNTTFNDLQDVVQVDWLLGYNMSYRKNVFDEFRFDEWFEGYGLGEDLDFSYRVSKKYKLVATPFAKLEHKYSNIGRSDIRRYHSDLIFNHYYFFKKNMKNRTIIPFIWADLGYIIYNISFFLIGLNKLNNLLGIIHGNIRIVDEYLKSKRRRISLFFNHFLRLILLNAVYHNFILQNFLYKFVFRPNAATFLITNNCNSRCISCNCWKQKSSNELRTNEINNILIQLKEFGILDIFFTGGEPLLRHDLPKIIRKSRDLQFDKIILCTNGLLLDKNKAETLLRNGLTGIRISIDGLEETHDILRGIKGSYKKVYSVLKILTELRDTKYPYLELWITTTLMEPNLTQIKDILKICEELNIKFALNLLDIAPYFFKDVNLSNLIIKNQEKLNLVINKLHEIKRKSKIFTYGQTHTALEYAKKYLKDPKMEDIPCYLGYLDIYIGAHGEVYSGCWALKSLGNLRDKNLKEIVTSKEYKKRLRAMLLKKCPGCSCGHQKNLFYHIPSICEEIFWRLHFKK